MSASFHSALKIDQDDQLYQPGPAQFSPIRKLALAVLNQAVHDAKSKSPFQLKSGQRAAGVSAFDWLHHWYLVDPWCRVAEISPTRLKRRIACLTP